MDRGPRLVCELHPFERDWHDWIVKKDGQLAAFTRYIRENPYRAWLRRQNRQYFGAAKPDKRTMYARCHEMVDLALERLG